MKQRKISLIYKICVFIFFFLLLSTQCFANPLANWQDSKAYKPRPVLFLHGFNSNSGAWQPAIAGLSRLFSKYQTIGPYLEAINIQDNAGSVDTYPDGKAGWTDRLEDSVNALLARTKYGFYTNKINLVCHSMGGLAAREYLTNPKYSSLNSIDKLVLVGVPNLGSHAAIVAKDFIAVFKVGSITIMPATVTFFQYRNITDSYAKYLLIPNVEPTEGIKDMIPESSFLVALNNRFQPNTVKYYGICGIISHWLNWFLFKDYYGGDGIVSKDSQIGKDKVSFTESPRQIAAFHTEEPVVAASGENPILRYLDSTPPEFEITSPSPSGTTEIYESSVHIQGRVYKEYLPADSQLLINVARQEDGYTLPTQISFLKPSDLWIANNPDSPVAEFDEVVNFPGKGTYKISCQVKNPAAKTSVLKEIWVKVIVAEGTNIIVHCHNPEGKEINSIQGIAQIARDDVEIYDGDTLIAWGAYDSQTHNKPIAISEGTHIIKAKFNGMVKEEVITLAPQETKILTFVFERREFDLAKMIDDLNISMTVSDTGTLHGPNTYESSYPYPGQNKFWFDVFCSIRCDWQPSIIKSAKMDFALSSDLFLSGSRYKITWDAEMNSSIEWGSSADDSDLIELRTCLNIVSDPTTNFRYPPAMEFPISSWPASAEFNSWYIQHMFTGNFPAFQFPSFEFYSPGKRLPVFEIGGVWLDKYGFVKWSTSEVIDKLIIGWLYFGGCINVFENFPYSGGYEHAEITYNGTQTFKMSSVPYDLLETGI